MDYSNCQKANRLVVVGMLLDLAFLHDMIVIEFAQILIFFWFQVAEGANPFRSNPGYE